ncbi:periplasmic heavy metal sensor [Aliiroseovarius sp. PTFE2010]|uniref:periplasmic heavy metal sensor n=1 Tax=Aliiroseovarius sp. PTFE2010 TaxID=3417190 RepID=UPI003CF38053
MADATQPKRKFHVWRVLTVVSLAINLLIIGLVAGAAYRFKEAPPPRDLAARDVGYGAFIAAFEREDRRDLGRAYRAHMPDRKQVRQEMDRQNDALLAVLRADPFQPEALEALLNQRQSRLNAMQMQGQELLLNQIRDMDPDARKDYADRLHGILTRGPDRRDRDEKGRDRDEKGWRDRK